MVSQRYYARYNFKKENEVDWGHVQEKIAYFEEKWLNKDTGARIKDMKLFKRMSCFLLNHPGKCVNTFEEMNGKVDLDKLDKHFKILIKAYFKDVFSRITNSEQKMTPTLLEQYIRDFSEVFKNGKNYELDAPLEMRKRRVHFEAKGKAIEKFGQEMDREARGKCLNKKVFEKVCNAAKKEAKARYEAEATFEKSTQDKAEVDVSLTKVAVLYREANELRLRKYSVLKYTIVLVVIVFSMLGVFISKF